MWQGARRAGRQRVGLGGGVGWGGMSGMVSQPLLLMAARLGRKGAQLDACVGSQGGGAGERGMESEVGERGWREGLERAGHGRAKLGVQAGDATSWARPPSWPTS